MSTLAVEIDETMQRLDAETASRLERLVRDALALVKPAVAPLSASVPEPLKIFRQLQQEVGLTAEAAEKWKAAVADARR